MPRSASSPGETILILGGAGMVGEQVAREAARALRPSRIVIAALTAKEVDAAIENLRRDVRDVELLPAPGNIFIPQSLQDVSRDDMVASRDLYDQMFAEIFSPEVDYRASALYRLVDAHKPQVIVDCINTATAISYQDEFTIARKTKELLDEVEEGSEEKLPELLRSVRQLLISQGVPQITRHILFLHRTLAATSVRVYVKVGTTGTGGMGINIPYTHSEDKPSLQLLAKSAIGFAHTGLLFLLARTPAPQKHGAIIKEVKPGALIGFKSLGDRHVKLKRDPAPTILLTPRQEDVGASLETCDVANPYPRLEGRDIPLKIVGADTGENGFFSIGEFQAITYPRQMEAVTPEEVARHTVLEILGVSTGHDVISAIDGAITDPSYRAGVLRAQAIAEMQRLEAAASEDVLPSIALGQLGPPKLSKLIAEAFLIVKAAETDDIAALGVLTAAELQERVERFLAENPRIVSMITTIGIPLLRATDGKAVLTRGPRINIPPPPPNATTVPLDADSVAKYARSGWVDLRRENFETWRERIARLAASRPDIVSHGSAAFALESYPGDRFVPGDVVGWLLTNEIDEQGMVGHRLF